ncbi:MAG: hypothetical protein PHH08_03510 [Candidatus ainarchaeum sp.]|nr:hypothetical protein [Candidatus ainarchaeum sp.]
MVRKKLKPKAKKRLKGGNKASSKKASAQKGFEKRIEKLEGNAKSLVEKIGKIRTLIEENESSLKQKIGEKTGLEDKINGLLQADFESEKSALEQILNSSKEAEFSLKEKAASLQRITRIYDEKKTRILEAKKRQAFLRKQLERLNLQAREWA